MIILLSKCLDDNLVSDKGLLCVNKSLIIIIILHHYLLSLLVYSLCTILHSQHYPLLSRLAPSFHSYITCLDHNFCTNFKGIVVPFYTRGSYLSSTASQLTSKTQEGRTVFKWFLSVHVRGSSTNICIDRFPLLIQITQPKPTSLPTLPS